MIESKLFIPKSGLQRIWEGTGVRAGDASASFIAASNFCAYHFEPSHHIQSGAK